MVNSRPIEVYGKEDLCLDITGHTNRELFKAINEGPIDSIDNSIGRDMPRGAGETAADRYFIFMRTAFIVPISDKPKETLFQYYVKYRDWERSIHPQETHDNQREFWEPRYRLVELAYKSEEEPVFISALSGLINAILHD